MSTSIRNKMMLCLAVTGCVFMAQAFTAQSAMAGLIGVASFGYNGAFTIEAGKTLGNNHQINITNKGAVIVTAPSTDDLSGVVDFGNMGTEKNILNISSFVPIVGFLKLADGVSFDLESLSIDSRIGKTKGIEFLNLDGIGILHAPTISPKPILDASWTFTGTSTNNKLFTFASVIDAAYPVPEPHSFALLAMSFLSLVMLRWKSKRLTKPYC
jgi:hypothetical protein